VRRASFADFFAHPALDLASPESVRARPAHLSGLSVVHSESVFYGAFVWVRRALNSQKRWFPARAGGQGVRRRAGAADRGGGGRRGLAAGAARASGRAPRGGRATILP
jgi:hypothetical protein